MTGAKVTIEFESGIVQKLNFKTFSMNLQQDINPDNESGEKKDAEYTLGSKHGVLYGFLEDDQDR